MYKALNQHKNEEIVILDSKWINRIGLLRSLDRQDILVCQGCYQPVRVRAGEIKRWHFAHKHLQNCPYEHESPIILKTRAVLYGWLVVKFGEQVVTLEKKLDGSPFPRHIDCWVERESGCYAYWIIDTRLVPETRDNLKKGARQIKANMNWVFVSELLHEDEFEKNQIHLTTTEREFMVQSVYDEPVPRRYQFTGKSLHYIDPDQELLTTFRSLQLIHPPQLFVGIKMQQDLSKVLVSTETGEFVYPGEYQRLQEFKKVQEEKNRREEVQKLAFGQRVQQPSIPYIPTAQRKVTHKPASHNTGIIPYTPFGRVGTCRICGIKTSDWVTFYGKSNECICRNCKDKIELPKK